MASAIKTVFLDRDSLDKGDLDLSHFTTLTDFTAYPATTRDQILTRLSDAEIVTVNKVVLDAEILRNLPRLKLICVIATGTNNIDIPAASECGILVCNVKDYAAAAVSQHVFMLILALYTQFTNYQEALSQGKWQAQDQFCLLDFPIRELRGKTLGLIGYGHIAQAVERIARAFEMDVLIARSLTRADQQDGRTELTDLLRRSDIISLHCPLSEASRDLIAAPQLELMKSSAILINTARGGIVNEPDLLQALHAGSIGGAGLDGLCTEPPDDDDPLLNAQLPQLIITPHNAWGAIEARQRLVDGTSANISAYIDDRFGQQGNPRPLNP
jgi:glycerate dehydrogenase